jgi:hypothetical protein
MPWDMVILMVTIITVRVIMGGTVIRRSGRSIIRKGKS